MPSHAPPAAARTAAPEPASQIGRPFSLDTPSAVLLSGGVDSSVALWRVVERARRLGAPPPIAFYLKIWLEDELAHLGHCPWEEDLQYARQVCAAAGVELEVVPMQRRYHELVVDWAIEELRAGRTPSPDILCNRRVKFGAFVDLLDEMGELSTVVSGHYARLRTDEESRSHLLRGLDPVKDQTYFLFELDQRQLGRAEFPIGGLTKAEVRAEAQRLGLATRHRPDSQGICFLGKIRFEEFVRAQLGDRPGPIRRIDDGSTLGEHRGHWFHTIGQRKGLGLGGGPWYVVAKEPATDTLWVSHGETLARFRRRRFRVPSPHWVVDRPPDGAVRVRVRHGPRLAEAHFEASGPDHDGITVHLAEADPGIAPGQVAVLYRGEECLGGGQIALDSSSTLDPAETPLLSTGAGRGEGLAPEG